jgi:glutamyl-tRNA reductase
MRQKEMIEAETLLKEEKAAFCNWRESLAAIPTINQLQEKANIVREEELNKCTRKLNQNGNLSDKEMEAVERLSRGIVNKLLHGPMQHLRSSENSNDQQNAIKELSAMFQLQDQDGDNRRGGRRGRSRRK